jgi:uncharacterized protein YjiS (DUF1127 family)
MTMTLTAPTAAAGHAWTGISARVTAAVRGTMRRMQARHDYRKLLERDDAMLRDIGVTRADVRRALDETSSWQ